MSETQIIMSLSDPIAKEIDSLCVLWGISRGEALSRCIGLAKLLTEAERNGERIALKGRCTWRQVFVRDWGGHV